MDFEVWLTFCTASLALLAVPGPVVFLLFGYTLSGGRSVAVAAIPGVVFGDLVAMTISLLGAGAVLQTSATLFVLLKIAGAAYLIWLGLKIWNSDAHAPTLSRTNQAPSRTRVMRDAFLVTAFNPKDIVFFVAFLPQFIDPARPALPQVATLEASFAVLVFCSTTGWVVFADRAARQLTHSNMRKLTSRIGASWLIGAGIVTAARV